LRAASVALTSVMLNQIIRQVSAPHVNPATGRDRSLAITGDLLSLCGALDRQYRTRPLQRGGSPACAPVCPTRSRNVMQGVWCSSTLTRSGRSITRQCGGSDGLMRGRVRSAWTELSHDDVDALHHVVAHALVIPRRAEVLRSSSGVGGPARQFVLSWFGVPFELPSAPGEVADRRI